MRAALAVSLLLATGCSRLLGFEDLHASDAGSIDAERDAPVTCDAGMVTVQVAEDTMLVDENGNPNPSIRHGADPINDLGLNGTSRIVLRFDLSSAPAVTSALAGSSGTLAATLTVRMAMTGGATTFQVFAASDGWNEGTGNYVGASWFQRIGQSSTVQTPWQQPGADGLADRSQVPLATRVVTASEATANATLAVTLPLDGTARSEVLARLASGRLSLLLVPTAGGTLFLSSRESVPAATELAFAICP
jgi:hypothetical protein